jgi:hypothetical protein
MIQCDKKNGSWSHINVKTCDMWEEMVTTRSVAHKVLDFGRLMWGGGGNLIDIITSPSNCKMGSFQMRSKYSTNLQVFVKNFIIHVLSVLQK